MSSDFEMQRLDSIAAINPPRRIKKGLEVQFVEMAALPQDSRNIEVSKIERRIAKNSGSHFKNGDTLLARITPCLENGKTAQVKCLKDGEIAEGSTEFIVLCGIDKDDDDYIYYLCRDPEFREYAIARMEGTSGRQRVAWQSIASYEFPFPPADVRRSAAEFLSAIDDEISVIRETNKTLEAIAQAIFKSWFIDFDPVKAKSEGRTPEGIDATTAALFPDSFEQSALGPIPKGWSIQRLGDVIELAYGKALKAEDRNGGDVPVYGSGGISGYHNVALVQEPSIVVGRKGTVGSLYWEDRPFYPIDTTFYVKPKKAPLTFCFYAMQRLGLDTMNTDAAVPGLNRENAYRLNVVMPPSDVMSSFDDIVSTLRDGIRANQDEADTLVQLRDKLLPRLISGKLKLPEAQEIVQAL